MSSKAFNYLKTYSPFAAAGALATFTILGIGSMGDFRRNSTEETAITVTYNAGSISLRHYFKGTANPPLQKNTCDMFTSNSAVKVGQTYNATIYRYNDGNICWFESHGPVGP